MTAVEIAGSTIWVLGLAWSLSRRGGRILSVQSGASSLRYLLGSVIGYPLGVLGYALATSGLSGDVVNAGSVVAGSLGAVVFGALFVRDGAWKTVREIFFRR